MSDVEPEADDPTEATPTPAVDGHQERRDSLQKGHHQDHFDLTEVVEDARAPSRLTGRSNLDQVMPLLLFIVVYNVVDIRWAVVASTAWSIKAAYSRRRRGLRIGWWLPAVTGYLIARSIVTILVDEEILDFGVSSEAVYFGIGISTKVLIGSAVMVSILVGRPLLVWGVPMLVALPDELLADPRYRRTMSRATWVIVAYELGSSAWDIWLYNNSDFNVFFLTRSAVNFAISFLAITLTLMWVDRRLEPIESYPGLTKIVESAGSTR